MATSALHLTFLLLALVTSYINRISSTQPRVCIKDAYIEGGTHRREFQMNHHRFDKRILCDVGTDGGGWIIFQKRSQDTNPSVNFTQRWRKYRDGFGNLNNDFWLGNEFVYTLTNDENYTLRVDIIDDEGVYRYADYSSFKLLDEQHHYTIRLGDHSGTLGEEDYYGMSVNRGSTFSTYDRDNDGNATNSWALWEKAGFWYHPLWGTRVTLNGPNWGRYASSAGRIQWRHRDLPYTNNTYFPKMTRMMLRKA